MSSEPYFNHCLSSVSPEMLQEWVVSLLQENVRALKFVKPTIGSSFCFNTVQCVFLFCERLKMSNEVKYLTIELFDGFIAQHVIDLYGSIQNTYSAKTRAKQWRETKKKVGSQVILRILTCIRIACKLTSHNKIFSVRKMQICLQETGHRYSLQSICQSELRVLKTLNFKVSKSSPLVFMETFIEILGRNYPDMNVKDLYGVAQKILDMVYLKHVEVFYMLHKIAAGGTPITSVDKVNFAVVKADKVLLICAVISAATYMMDIEHHQKVMHSLSNITAVPTMDIADFSSILLQMIKL